MRSFRDVGRSWLTLTLTAGKFLVARRNDPASAPQERLSPRESQVAALASFGHSNKVIAYELGISLSTVATLLKSALTKLGLTTRLELIQVFLSTVMET
jgi:DNA-binding NarL/FixJ family response regulator